MATSVYKTQNSQFRAVLFASRLTLTQDYYSSKRKGKQYKQITAIPITKKLQLKSEFSGVNPGLASLGFEQPGPDVAGGIQVKSL